MSLSGLMIRQNGYIRPNKYQINNSKMKKKKLENQKNALVSYDEELTNEDQEDNINASNPDTLDQKNHKFTYDYITGKMNNKKGILHYKNGDKTLTEKFVTKFTDKLQKELEEINNHKLQLLKNKEEKKIDFLNSLKGFQDEIDNIDFNQDFKIPFKENEIRHKLFFERSKNNSEGLFLTDKNNLNKKSVSTSMDTNFTGHHIDNSFYKNSNFNKSPGNQTSYIPQYNNKTSPIKNAIINRMMSRNNPYEEIDTTPIAKVRIKFPKIAKTNYPLKINNMTRGLNSELARINRNYGKTDAFKRYKESPVSQYYFDNSDYLAYRTSKISENKELFRPKFKPLKVSKDPMMEKMASSIFFMRSNLLNTIKEFSNDHLNKK